LIVKLDTPTGLCIFDALWLKELHYNDIVDAEVDKFIRAKAKQLYATKSRGRSPEQVLRSVMRGDVAERAVALLLERAGFTTLLNDVEQTLEYHWDVLAAPSKTLTPPGEPAKLEVKCMQALARDRESRSCFSISVDETTDPSEVIGTLTMMWRSYDFVIAVLMDESFHFRPWMLIDSVAFASEGELFVKSRFGDGYMLKSDIARQRGLVKHLRPLGS
jgi:hypothetical protein